MNESLFLCLDQGGSASRGMIFDAQGNSIVEVRRELETHKSRHYSLLQPSIESEGSKNSQQQGLAADRLFIEQNPRAVLQSLRDCARQAVATLDESQRRRLTSAALVCQRSSLLAWRLDSGEPLTSVISWQDTRAADALPTDPEWQHCVYSITGLRPGPHFGASKMQWCLQHIDDLRQVAEQGRLAMAPLASYLCQQLLSEQRYLLDPANAQRTLLMGLDGEWAPPLLAHWGIARELLPDIVASDSLFGHLPLAGLPGLGLPLRLLGGDQSAAAFATGEPRVGELAVNMGTGAFLSLPCEAAQLPARGLLKSVVFARAGDLEYRLEGTVNGAASALAEFYSHSDMSAADLPRALSLSAEPPLYLNGIGGLGSPDWCACPSYFFSLDAADDGVLDVSPLLQLLAVAESVVFLLQRNIEQIGALQQVSSISASGGLARLDGLCQRLADLSGLPVRRSAECEASARGAVFLLAGRPDDWRQLASDEFWPLANEALHQRYHFWQQRMPKVVAAGG